MRSSSLTIAISSESPSSSSISSTSSSSSSSAGGMGSGSGTNNKPSTKSKEGSPKGRYLTSPSHLRELLSVRYYNSTATFRHYDEIVEGLYLGDMKAAKNILNLQKLGITHVLNSAYTPSPFSDRELSQAYYEDRNFQCSFLGIAAQDFPSYKIGIYFEETTAFIQEALKSGGKVFVHCQVGVSRSATIVLAYLMMKRKMSAIEAVTHVGAIRPIFPNEGFLKQICELECRLRNPKYVLIRSLSNVSRRTFRKVFSKN